MTHRDPSPSRLAPGTVLAEHNSASDRIEESCRFRHPMTDREWSEALQEVTIHASKLDEKVTSFHIRKVLEGLQLLDEKMDEYCALTCPLCDDPCCHGRNVFFNQADLVFLVTSGQRRPPGQTREHSSESCRYLAAEGCTLSRKNRPYVCVWFLCEAQMRYFFEERPKVQREMTRAFEQIRRARLQLEACYERVRLSLCRSS